MIWFSFLVGQINLFVAHKHDWKFLYDLILQFSCSYSLNDFSWVSRNCKRNIQYKNANFWVILIKEFCLKFLMWIQNSLTIEILNLNFKVTHSQFLFGNNQDFLMIHLFFSLLKNIIQNSNVQRFFYEFVALNCKIS